MSFAHYEIMKKALEDLNKQLRLWINDQMVQDQSVDLRRGLKEYIEELTKLEEESGIKTSSLAVGDKVGSSLYNLMPKQTTKVIHFIRHANGYHNPPISSDRVDPRLTEVGWEQAKSVKRHIISFIKDFKVEIIVTSPLTRTLETAAAIFGNECKELEDDEIFMMGRIEDKANCCPGHDTIYKPKHIQVLAQELLRERLLGGESDKRRSISKLKKEYPSVDFSRISNDNDELWEQIKDENCLQMKKRVNSVITWLLNRPQSYIAVVSHAALLAHIMDECCEHLRGEVMRQSKACFQNGELRTYVLSISDTSVINNLPKGTWFSPAQWI